MKTISKLFSTLLLILLTQFSFGQDSETFTNIPTLMPASYLARTWTGDDGLSWNALGARTDQVIIAANKAICFKTTLTSPSVSGGIGDLTITTKFPFADGTMNLPITVNGVSVGTVPVSTTATTTTITGINVIGSIQIVFTSDGTKRPAIDNLSWTGYSSSNTITTSAIIGSPFCANTAVSVPYAISGTFTGANVFTAQLSNAAGSFAAPVAIGTLSSTAAGTIAATLPTGTATGAGYRIRVIGNTPSTTGTDNGTNLTINTDGAASVSIGASPSNTICTGTSVTFTATPTNGGAGLTYQWKLNGGNVGTGLITYTNAGLANNDVVTCIMTSNAACVTGSPATSNAITMVVGVPVMPSVSIAASANPVCAGTNVTFTATPTNGGTPSYQWKLNGVNVGTNSNTYANAGLVNTDAVSCVMTASGCVSPATATSNTVTMTINALPATPTAGSNNPICSGATLNLTSNAAGTISWTGPNTFTASTQNPSIVGATTAAAGTYSVTSTVGGCTSVAGTTVVVINSGATISVQPASTSTSTGANATFTVTATGVGLTYQWEESTNGGGSFSTITNGGIYSGATTATLTLTGVTIVMDTYKYRCVITGTCGNATSNGVATLTVTTVVYAAGDYRTNPAFTATNPFLIIFFNSTVSVNGVAPWQIYSGGAWVDVAHATGSPNSPMNLATKPPTIYISHGDYANGIYTDAAGAGTYGNIVVLSGGYLVSFSATGPTIPTGKTLDVQSGGYLELAGFGAAPFTLASGSALKVRDGGTIITNNSTINNGNAMWSGTEDFQDNSTFVVQNWDNSSSPTVRSLLNPTYQVPVNSSGQGYRFGNIIYNYNPATNDQTILPALTSPLLFCNNLTINNISTTKSISITANKIQSPIATIRGNVTIMQGMANFGINYTNNALQQISILGNIDIQNTQPATNPTVVYLHNFQSGTTILNRMQVYLGGNLSVASGAFLSSGLTADASSKTMTMFYFTGTHAQSINGTGTINLNNVTINKSANNVTLNRDFTVIDSLFFTSGNFILGANTLQLGTTAIGVQTGGSSTSYAVTDGAGSYKRMLLANSTAYTFPVGPSITSYNPAIINYTGTVDDFSARVEVGLNPTTGNDPAFVNRTWNIAESVAGGTTASLTLQWDAAHENVSFVRAGSNIYHYTGGAWVELTGSTLGGANPYTSLKGSITSFSPFTVGKTVALPIKLLYFDAQLNNDVVDLDWATTIELNNDYFDVEKSVDGINFTHLLRQSGAGNSNVTKTYYDYDLHPISGVNYYRLKQTDFNGEFSYSNIKAVVLNNNEAEIPIVYQNGMFVKILNNYTNAMVRVYDLTGNLVIEQANNNEINTSSLSRGIYILSSTSGVEQKHWKIMVK